ncbi:MAG TPA: hypothetical protein VM943_07095, partial [Pyrinomonadaceae bacterium]|nr:hypothetical protein [Pyrinomonadaceae bacterium]
MRLKSLSLVRLFTFSLGIALGVGWHTFLGNQPQIPIEESRPIVSAKVEAQNCTFLSDLKAEFQKHNPKLANFKVVDMRPTTFGPLKYLVVGWGIKSNWNFENDFNTEVFGLFLVDGSLMHVEKTLDFIPTPRWLDTEVRITHVD